MFRNRIFLISGAVAVLILLAAAGYFFLYSSQQPEAPDYDPAFGEHIAAYTSGRISKAAPIKVRLTEKVVDQEKVGEKVDQQLFSFKPSIEGQAVWLDRQTVKYEPSANLQSSKKYYVEFALAELKKVPDDLATFAFDIKTLDQSFEVEVEGLQSIDQSLELQQLEGRVVTADIADKDKVEDVLTASQQDRSLSIDWEHLTDQNIHRFTVDTIQRSKDSSSVTLSADGSPIGVAKKEERTVTVPALGDFKVESMEVNQQPEQYLAIRFSDPLREDQDLNGLIRMAGVRTQQFMIDGNVVRVYPGTRQEGNVDIFVSQGIENIESYSLKDDRKLVATFSSIKPDVRMVGDGVILPNSEKSVIPFEAVNLKAVDVAVVRVYESNIPQFLQVNELDDDDELQRVGKVVELKKVSLKDQQPMDLGKWNRFTLDLSSIVDKSKNALYHVVLSFKPKYSLHPCDGGEGDIGEDDHYDENATASAPAFWDFVDDYYPYGSGWSNREDPCYRVYYRKGKWVKRNLMTSNLGITTKKGKNNDLFVSVTKLSSTEPVKRAKVKVLNYQQKTIRTVKTDGKGWADIDLSQDQKPFLVVAEKDDQKGYLKVDDGSSLSLSRFDVSGQEVQEGLKGYIYGERGVWRPGDTLHLTFMLEDQKEALPDNHPVTFELYNPKNQKVQKIVKRNGVRGLYSFQPTTSDDAPTGNWQAKVKVGGATFEKTLRIETVKPNRLAIDFAFDADYLTSGDFHNASLHAEWLHGATARNLKAKVDMSLTSQETSFKGWEGYDFDDPTRGFNVSDRTVFDDKLNDKGNADVQIRYSNESKPSGQLNAGFDIKVFEPGGNFSVDRTSLPFHPYEHYIGMKLPEGEGPYDRLSVDSTHQVKVAAVTPEGEAAPDRQVKLELYKLEWRWWWEHGSDDMTNFNSNSYKRKLKTKVVSVEDGKGAWSFDIDRSDGGRYFIRACDQDGEHCTGAVRYFSYPGWWMRQRDDQAEGAAMLTFSADKETYEVGEQATLTIPSSDKGRALVSVESGAEVLHTKWLETQKGQTRYTFDITEKMAPNVYVNVSMIQPHSQTANDRPIRMYGVVPISVEDPATHLEPTLSMPDELKPESSFTVEVGEENNKSMAYTVAVVDKGLLDLTNFSTPSPWHHFYAREALGVKTWDLYDKIVGAYGGELERLLSIGGGRDAQPEKGKEANRFEPVVRYLGPFELEEGQTNAHTINLPEYVGKVRTMVIAGDNGAYGSTEKTVPVRKSLMVLGTLPRVLGPGEQVKLPVTVFAMKDNVSKVDVSINTGELVEANEGSQKTIRFEEPGQKTIYFDLDVAKDLGVANVSIDARSGQKRASHTTELEVRNPNPRITEVTDTVLKTGKNWQSSYKPIGIEGTNEAVLEVSRIPSLNLKKRLDYLVDYPHGCMEQVVSGSFPQLFLDRLIKLEPNRKKEIRQNIKATIQKLRSKQRGDGSYSMWPGRGSTNDWITNYAGHFLIEAEQQGYMLSSDQLSKWKQYQRRMASSWVPRGERSELTQAYRLYTLALANAPEMSAMNRLRKRDDLPPQASWRLAAAYELAGQRSVAEQMIGDLPTQVEDYREYSRTYGSHTRDEAMILETLALMDKKQKGYKLLKRLAGELGSSNWLSTQTTSFSLIAIAKYVGSEDMQGKANFRYAIGNQQPQDVTMNAVMMQEKLPLNNGQGGQVSVTNKGEGVLFARLILQGKPVAGRETKASNGLDLEIDYMLMNGEDITPTQIDQGTDFVAKVTVSNPGYKGDYEEIALSQIFPSGWEIHNTRMSNTGSSYSSSSYDYRDFRDDRVYTYFDLASNQKRTYYVLLNASYLGRYYLPAVQAEAMYDGTVNARSKGQWVEVVQPGTDMASK